MVNVCAGISSVLGRSGYKSNLRFPAAQKQQKPTQALSGCTMARDGMCWCSASARRKARHTLPQRSLCVPCGMWNSEVFFRPSLPGCAHQVKAFSGKKQVGKSPGSLLPGPRRKQFHSEKGDAHELPNPTRMSKQHITQPPLYLTLHGHRFPHVCPRDTVSAKLTSSSSLPRREEVGTGTRKGGGMGRG